MDSRRKVQYLTPDLTYLTIYNIELEGRINSENARYL